MDLGQSFSVTESSLLADDQVFFNRTGCSGGCYKYLSYSPPPPYIAFFANLNNNCQKCIFIGRSKLQNYHSDFFNKKVSHYLNHQVLHSVHTGIYHTHTKIRWDNLEIRKVEQYITTIICKTLLQNVATPPSRDLFTARNG